MVVATVAYAFTSISRTPAGAISPAGVGTSVTPSGNVQASDGGGVQAQVVFDPRTASQGQAITFVVTMNTHSVELGNYDLSKLSRVILDQGDTLTQATWQPKGAGNGHHVEGTLTVQDPKGVVRAARSVTLEIRGLPGSEVRRFEWKVPVQ